MPEGLSVWMCEANGCDRQADWAYIGEGGDLFLCTFHGGTERIEGWQWIGEGEQP